MAKSGFWKSERLLGAAVTLVMLLAVGSDLLHSLEGKAYDLGVQLSRRAPSEQVAVIAIDERSIAALGPWPWSRALHARLTDLLAGAPAKVIASTELFSAPQIDPGYAYVTRLSELVKRLPAETAPSSPVRAEMAALLTEAELALDGDRRLADSYARAGNAVQPLLFELGGSVGPPDRPLPPYVAGHRLQQVGAGRGFAPMAADVHLPIEALGRQALALGHLNRTPDGDGAVRSEPLVVQFFDQYYPSLALMIAARSLGLGAADIRVRLGEEVRLGRLRIATDAATRMNTFFYRGSHGRPAFPVDSFGDVLSGKVPASKYAGKIVLIGVTAAGLGAPQLTPVAPAMDSVLILAHTVSSLLQEDFFVAPAWGFGAGIVCLLLIGLYLIFVLPQLGAGLAALATLTLLLLLLTAQLGLMLGAGLWIPLSAAASLLLVGHLALTAQRLLTGGGGDKPSALDSPAARRLLGLALQGQGQLDLAFDKFRQCPMDDALLENLYNLALDYERQRQFTQAEAVLRTIAEHDPNFRDVEARLNRQRPMPDSVAGAPASAPPMLGRYRLDKELGKGAMGIVYLGHDPTMNRVVAIKTMALAQEFDADELADVKQRFFREAETAGRLSHPNIVTMYEAGEERDLAYIAMEFLKGRDLVPQSKPGALLPLPTVLSIVARVADALDYAHAQSVVHRDIKPANIMYEAASDQVKVTDFGIARITDSSRTKTGMVLGTPSYMSPEQLAGRKIDGRSDLYSLGVTLYQLCSGQLPFIGESLALLMYRIANDPAPDILAVNPALPAEVATVIARAMAKSVDQRYQRGAELAADLRRCLGRLDDGGAA